MAAMRRKSAMAAEIDDEYVRSDFKRWNLTFALKGHTPAENKQARGLSAGQAKKEVLHSTRLQRIIKEASNAFTASTSPPCRSGLQH